MVPVLGTNGPLWSLANEFWYYVVFPLVAVGLIGRGQPWFRGLALATAVALALVLPPTLMMLDLIWGTLRILEQIVVIVANCECVIGGGPRQDFSLRENLCWTIGHV